MIARPHRTAPSPTPLPDDGFEPGFLSGGHAGAPDEAALEPELLLDQPAARDSGAGGRQVLGWALSLLAAAWIGFAAWSAGRLLPAGSLASPALAQWIAIAAGPLALLGLGWLVFGRTRRREAERFTRSVIAMRTEAHALHDLLAALSRQIDDNHKALGIVAGDLMNLGDQAAQRIGGVARELEGTSVELQRRGDALDRAALSARTDIGVLLADLPEAEKIALAMANALRDAGREATERAATYREEVERLGETAAATGSALGEAATTLETRLAAIEDAGAKSGGMLTDVATQSHDTIERLMTRSAVALEHVRAGIDEQALALDALLERSSAGMAQAGLEATDRLGDRIDQAGRTVDGLSARIAEQERASQRLLADLEQGIAGLDERFAAFAEAGDTRASAIARLLSHLRSELAAFTSEGEAQQGSIEQLDERTRLLRERIDELAGAVRDQLHDTLGTAEESTQRIRAVIGSAVPEVRSIRESTADAERALARSNAFIEQQHERMAGLLNTIDSGVDAAGGRLAALQQAVDTARVEAERLAAEAAPAMLGALSQVREAAGHAAERAREAIARIIPESAGELGERTREALEQAVRDAVEERLAEVDRLASRAVEAARHASDRLTSQMISIGQTASALEDHMVRVEAERQAHDSETFGRRVDLLIDSMHSASIDVAKILGEEVDEKAWASYLKGQRGIFTRRAARLAASTESRAIVSHYDSDPEFQEAANRFLHDYEAMLRRVMDQDGGGMMSVALMGSDLGKLYAALAQAIDRKL